MAFAGGHQTVEDYAPPIGTMYGQEDAASAAAMTENMENQDTAGQDAEISFQPIFEDPMPSSLLPANGLVAQVSTMAPVGRLGQAPVSLLGLTQMPGLDVVLPDAQFGSSDGDSTEAGLPQSLHDWISHEQCLYLNPAATHFLGAHFDTFMVQREGHPLMQRFIVHLVTGPKVKSTCAIAEIDEASAPEVTMPASLSVGPTDDAILQLSDDEVVEIALPGNLTRCRRRRKLRCPLDVKFLRRSPRLNPDLAGFRTKEAAEAAAAFRASVISGTAAPPPELPLQLV